MDKKDDAEKTPITDVRQATFAYLAEHPLYYVLIFIIVFVGTYLSFYASDTVALFALIALFGIYIVIANKMRGYMMKQFADSLGYTYSDTGDFASVQGSLFSIGHSQRIYDVISGTDKDRPVRIYLYQYTVGYGRDSHTCNYTIFENTFSGEIPHIVLHNVSIFLSEDGPNFSGSEHISLEGDFNKYFSLSVEKGFETEAYEIFTPDFMEELIETSKTLGFEFSKNKLYIYMPKFVGTRAELDSMFALSDKLCTKIEPVINGMKEDVEDMEEVEQTVK
jgi:hypothetical protein